MVGKRGVPHFEAVSKEEFQKDLVVVGDPHLKAIDNTWKPEDLVLEPASGDDTFGYGLEPIEPAKPAGAHICRDRGNGCNICGKR